MATMTTTMHAGAKRKSQDIGDQERLAKRFDLLNLKSSHKHYLPKPNLDQQDALHHFQEPTGSSVGDVMHVESTKDRVYIHDLDAELAEMESDHEFPVFLPDIEKHLSKIPPHLLVGEPRASIKDKQLVLYNVPKSVSLPADADNVRKAIIESRNRARLEQRAQYRKERRGEMDVETDEDRNATPQPRPVLAKLKWRDSASRDENHAHDADDENETSSDTDAMDMT